MTQVLVIAATSLVTFVAIVLFYYHHVQDWVKSGYRRYLIMGTMLGIGASLLMLNPIELTSDVTYNTRPMFMGFAGLIGGWVGAGSALFIAIVTRIAIGGPDMIVGILVLGVAAGLGVLGHIFLIRTKLRPAWSWAVAGGLLSISVSLFWVMILPEQVPASVSPKTIPIMIVFSIISAVGVGYLLTGVRDVVANRQDAMKQSRIDDLTGVLNRRGLTMAFQSHVFQKQEFGIAVLSIDLDHFKSVNDSLGHVVGDQLLRLTADQISALIRKEDIVARMGGDEFVVILTNITKEKAENMAERLCASIRNKDWTSEIRGIPDTKHDTFSVSIGLAFASTQPADLDKMFEMSDRLLYKAKRHGRGNVVAADFASIDHSEPAFPN